MSFRWPTSAGAFALLLCLFTPPARGETRAVVAVGPCGDGQTLEATRQVREALAQTPFGYQFISETATAERLGGMPGSLAEAKGLLDSARDDLFRRDQPQWSRAEDKLRKGLSVLETVPPSEERFDLFARTSAVLAFVLYQQAQGRPDHLAAAEAALFPVLSVDRTVPLDPQHFLLPSFTRNFVGEPGDRKSTDTVRGKLRTMLKGEIEFLSTPDGVPVAVNGKPIGTTPVKLTFEQGTYVVEGVFPGRRGLPMRLTVRPGSVERVMVDALFDGAVHQTKGPCLVTPEDRDRRVALLARLGRTLGVDAVVGVRIHEPTPGDRFYVAGVVETESGRERHQAQIPVEPNGPRPGALAQLAEFLLEGKEPRSPSMVEVLNGDKPAGQTKPGLRADVRRSSTTWRQPVGFTGVGLGVAGLAGAGYFFTQMQDYSGRMEAVCPAGGCSDETSLAAYSQLRAVRDDRMKWMAVSGVAGLVLAGAGGGVLMSGGNDGASAPRMSAAMGPGGITLWGRF